MTVTQAVAHDSGRHDWGGDALTVAYGHRVALQDVTVEVSPGTVTVVIGGDGAGKTTLLRALAGVVPVRHGTVRRPSRRRIGYVAGAAGLYDDLSVDENIAFAAAPYGVRGDLLKTRAAELLRETGLEGTGGRLAGRLSGGMRQKLAFALAMLHEPELLILDEPTTGVDPVSRAELWRMIARVAAAGAAVIVSTTYLDEAQRASSVVALEAGRVVSSGPPEKAAAAQTAGPGHAATAATAGRPLAAAVAVTRRFGQFTAVDAVDLEVRPGEIVGLLGANGAGKTTLLRLLLGLLPPSEGGVRLFGSPPSRAGRRRIGYVPQGLGLWEDLTVAENLAFSAQAFGTPPPPLDDDLAAARDTLVRDLPLGLRRRLAFAAALAHQPELLVLDEPTSGVEPQARQRLWETVHQAAEGRQAGRAAPSGTAPRSADTRDAGAGDAAPAHAPAGVLVTTHHLDEAYECDRLLFLTAGRVVAAGTPAAIVGDRRAVRVVAESWPRAYTVLDQAGLTPALVGRALRVPGENAARVEAVLEAGGVAARLDVVPATLEETFVTLSAQPPRKDHQ